MIRTQLKKYKPFAQGIKRQLTGYNYFVSLLLFLLANIWQGVGENQNLETNSADVLDRYERLKVEYASEFTNKDFLAQVDSLMNRLQQLNDGDTYLEIGLEKWQALNQIGFYTMVQDEIEYVFSQNSLKISLENKEKASLLLMQAYVNSRAITKAQSLGVEILQATENIETATRAKYYLSVVYAYAGKYQESIELLTENLDYYITINDTAAQIVVLNNAAQTNQDLNRTTQTEYFFKRAETLAIESGDLENQLLIYSNMGVFYKTQQNYELARAYYEKGLTISLQRNDLSATAQNMFNIGNIYYEEGNYREAVNYYNESLEIVEELNYEYPKALIYMMKGAVSIDLGFYDEANQYLMQAKKINSLINDLESSLFLYDKLSTLKQLTGDYQAAFEYLSNIVDLKDQKFASTSLDSLNQAVIKFQLNEEMLRLENTAIEYEKLIQQRVFGIALILLLGIGLSITLVLNNRKKALIEKLFSNYKTERQAESNTQTKGKKSLISSSNNSSNNVFEKLFFINKSKGSIPSEHQDLFNQIGAVVLEEELFRDTELTLVKLAKRVNSNTTYVSEAINSNLGMRFNSFLNRIRIHEAQKIMLEQDEPIDRVMRMSGYRNRSTFYRAFQAETGLTPREFITSK
jgi:AraC-like DNA-binding protein/tetratricopeptide (TPR) repeat protein